MPILETKVANAIMAGVLGVGSVASVFALATPDKGRIDAKQSYYYVQPTRLADPQIVASPGTQTKQIGFVKRELPELSQDEVYKQAEAELYHEGQIAWNGEPSP